MSATEVIDRLSPKLEKVAGIKLYMQPVQDLTVDDMVSRTEYQYTLEDPNQQELNQVAAQLGGEVEEAAAAGGCGDGPAAGRGGGAGGDRSRDGLAVWGDAVDDRQHAV